MKSFNKILSLVLAFTMIVSLVAMPTAYARVFSVGDTSSYNVEVSFTDINGNSISEADAGDTVYVALALKSFSTLNSGYVDVELSGATFAAETDKLVSDIFTKDANNSAFAVGTTKATYSLVAKNPALLTSKNGKATYYAFPSATDIPLAVYAVTVADDADEVTASISDQNLYVGDANGGMINLATPSVTTIATTGDSLTVTGGEPPVVDPVITYSYSAAWNDVTTTAKVFPEGTEEADVKAAVVVTKVTTTDGVADAGVVMTGGFKVVLNDGAVTVTIDGEFDADVSCDLTYEIEEHVPVVTYDYDIDWKDSNVFEFGTSEAFIKSNIEVKKYTFEDGIKVKTEVLTTGYTVELDDGVAVVTVGGTSFYRPYTIIDKVEYKNVVLNADDEYEYELGKDEIATLVTLTVEKWVNDELAETITLDEGADYSLTVTFDENYNEGRIDVELIGEYDDLVNPAAVIFERINPTITYSDATAGISQAEFPEGVDEATIAAEVSAKAMKKIGNLQAEATNLIKDEHYTVSVDLEAKQVTVEFAEIFDADPVVIDFEIIPAVITYADASAVLSNDVFGAVPEAADIIARLTVTATKLKDGVEDGTVEITSDNYDVEIGEGVATITFKNAYADLDAVEVEFSVEEVAYGDPVIVADGTISADGKEAAEIIAEAWTLITATRDILTNGVVTGSEELDKEALEEIGVEVEYADGKVVFTLGSDVLAEISVSAGKLQFASADPRTSATEFVKFVGATLKNIFDNIKIKKDVFQIITLNDDEWETLTEAITNGDATVTVDGVTYDETNIADASTVVVDDDDSKSLEIAYKDVIQDVDVSLLEVHTDYANEDSEAPVVTITTDATEVQVGTDLTATVYVAGLVGNIETGRISLVYSNADVTAADIVAADGFEILSKEVDGNEITVVFTINDVAYDAGAGIFTVVFDTTNSDVNAKLGLAINDYALTRIVDMGGYNEYKPVNATIGNNVEVTVTAGDVLGYDYEVSYASGKTAFYTDADAVADVKVLAYTTTNGVVDPGQTPVDVTADCDIAANNGVITVDKDGVRITTLTYSIYEVAFDQLIAIETIGSVDNAKFVDNTSVKLNNVDVAGATIVLDGRNIKASVAGIKAEGTYVVAVAVPGYTKATINVVVSKKATLDGYNAAVVTGSKIYAGDINGDNRIDAVDFSDVTGKYGEAVDTKYDLYTGNTSTTVDNLDVTTMAHYFITLARGQVSDDGATITPYSGN